MKPETSKLPVHIRLNKSISSLMIAGTKMVPKCTEEFFDINCNRVMAACAMGAATLAAQPELINDPQKANTEACKLGQFLRQYTAKHPMQDLPVSASCPELPVDDIIVSLNDDERWSRPRIAKWLKSIGL